MTLNKNHTPLSKYEKLTKFAAATMLGGIALTGCGEKGHPTDANTTIRPHTAEATSSSSPSKEAVPSTSEVTIVIPENLDSSRLRTMSPEEITTAFQIKSSEVKTPEQFIAAFVQREQAMRMAGCNETETRYDQADGIYEGGMIVKYTIPAVKGLFNDEATFTNDWGKEAFQTYNRCLAMAKMRTVDQTLPPYISKATVDVASIKTHVNGDGSWDVSFDTTLTDNFAYQEANDLLHTAYPQTDTKNSVTLSGIYPNESGVLFANSYDSTTEPAVE